MKCHDRQTGNRRRKLYLRTSRLYERVSNIRKNSHRQIASALAEMADVVCVETLNVGVGAEEPQAGEGGVRRWTLHAVGRDRMAV